MSRKRPAPSPAADVVTPSTSRPKPDRVVLDVGGTTSKVSIIRNGEPVFQRGGKLMGIPVQTSFAMLRSLAIGGGSIAPRHYNEGLSRDEREGCLRS